MFDSYWRKRAHKAEAALAEAKDMLRTTEGAFRSLDMLMQTRAVLVSMTPKGRSIRLLFSRNGELTTIDAYATIDADWKTLERKLLQ